MNGFIHAAEYTDADAVVWPAGVLRRDDGMQLTVNSDNWPDSFMLKAANCIYESSDKPGVWYRHPDFTIYVDGDSPTVLAYNLKIYGEGYPFWGSLGHSGGVDHLKLVRRGGKLMWRWWMKISAEADSSWPGSSPSTAFLYKEITDAAHSTPIGLWTLDHVENPNVHIVFAGPYEVTA